MDGIDNSSPDIKYEYVLLFDFYGALLKDKNYVIFEDYTCNDMSLSEIAAEQGITRQGVRDSINRSAKKLIDCENKLGLIKRFEMAKSMVQTVKDEIQQIRMIDFDDAAQDIEPHLIAIDNVANSILDEL